MDFWVIVNLYVYFISGNFHAYWRKIDFLVNHLVSGMYCRIFVVSAAHPISNFLLVHF